MKKNSRRRAKRTKEQAKKGFLVSGGGGKSEDFKRVSFEQTMKRATAAASPLQLAGVFGELHKQFHPEKVLPSGIKGLTKSLNGGRDVQMSTFQLGKYEIERFTTDIIHRGEPMPILVCSYNKQNATFRALAIVENQSLVGRLFQGKRTREGKNDGMSVSAALSGYGYSSLYTRGSEAGFLHFQNFYELVPKSESK